MTSSPISCRIERNYHRTGSLYIAMERKPLALLALVGSAGRLRCNQSGAMPSLNGHRRSVTGLCQAAVWAASSTASGSAANALVTERPHMMHSKLCNGAFAPKFGNDRKNRIEVPQCGQDGEV